MKIHFFILLLVIPAMVQANSDQVEFFKGNLSSAKAKAASEGKLYFAEFSASWCAPCRVLEETTFREPEVINYIGKNYIPVKIDIDDFDGFALKQVYNVTTIPTIIIFNSKGKLLEKYSENLPASKMLALLKKYNIPENRIRSGVPQSYSSQKPVPKPPVAKPKPQQQDATPTHSPMRNQNTASQPDKRPNVPSSNISEPIAPTRKPEAPQGNGLYRFKVMHQSSKGFSVQIGAYQEYGNVLRYIANIQDDFDQPIIVHILKHPDRTVYKILVGEFPNRQAAIDYQNKIKNKGVPGVIKDLSTMK